MPALIVAAVLIIFGIIFLASTIKIVPTKQAYIVERLGKYRTTLQAGLNILIPFFDRVRYKHTLKEQAMDVAEQICITKDNISVGVDGVLYFQVIDPVKASYGIDNYRFASVQIAQTTMRSIIGKMELDKTFEERDTINAQIVRAIDQASDPWGVKVTRYEVKNITPPQSIKDAMEKQMRAEREKRAMIAESEGEKFSRINVADGEKQELIAKSEGNMTRQINEAKGKAAEIESIAIATASGIRAIAEAINLPGGKDAVNLRVAEQYIGEFGKLATKSNNMIIPSNMADISSLVATATTVFNETNKQNKG